jgi:hypothetical protein
MRIDGNWTRARLTYPYRTLLFDDEGEYWAVDYTRALLTCASPPSLTGGPHTVAVTVANYARKQSTYSWSFTVATPPEFSNPSPDQGATAATLMPQISVRLTGASPIASTEIKVNGVAIPSTYDTGAMLLAGSIPSPLPNGHDVLVTANATDTAGGTATLSWSFTVQIYADMPDTTTGCADCHAGYPIPNHPTDDCNACHGPGSPVGGGWDSPAYGPHGPEELAFNPAITCQYCHGGYSPPVPAAHPAPTSSYHQTSIEGCDECHVMTLTIEHYRHTDDSGRPLTCSTCHSSTDERVRDAIAAKQTSCVGCHDGHGDVGALHAGTETGTLISPDGGASAACVDCHYLELTQEHAKASSGGLGCSACHRAGGPVCQMARPWNKRCAACHSDTHAQYDQVHIVYGSDCRSCHGEPQDVRAHPTCSNIAPGGVGATGSCHASRDVVPATTWCRTCHPNE